MAFVGRLGNVFCNGGYLTKVVILQKVVTQQTHERTSAHDKSVCDVNSIIVLIYKHPSFNTVHL